MPDLHFIGESTPAPFEVIRTVQWIPRPDDFVTINEVRYKVEKLEYYLTVVAGNPLESNPRWVSSDYIEVHVSIPP